MARSENSPQYEYIKRKTAVEDECEPHSAHSFCGSCLWRGITIDPNAIPECTVCKEDTVRFGRLVKDNPNAKSYEFEVDCFKSCMWWEWFHDSRKMKCGCMCKGVCSCGKIKYKDKKKAVAPLVTVATKSKK
jgi:hypothetical protein